LTDNGAELIMSDGSAELFFLDPGTFRRTRRLPVRDAHGEVGRLNELEWVDGVVFANVWETDLIARIDEMTGIVTAWIDLTGLYPAKQRSSKSQVLNGIAHDPDTGHFLVTGKCWPRMFEVVWTPSDPGPIQK
jgi:glutamine cyclotransferase